jgi:hypothetical protein
MSTKFILAGINWSLSLCALGCVEAESSRLWAVITVFAWFGVSSVLLMCADRKGAKKERFKID